MEKDKTTKSLPETTPQTAFDIDIIKQLREFGTKMYILAILAIISLFTGGITEIFIFIFLLISLVHVKKLNGLLNDPHLRRFRKNMIFSILTSVVGILVIIVVGMIFGFYIVTIFNIPMDAEGQVIADVSSVAIDLDAFLAILTMLMVIVALSGGIMTVSFAFGIFAWKSLQDFFEMEKRMFPKGIDEEAATGSKQLKMSSILSLIVNAIVIILALISLVLIPAFLFAEGEIYDFVLSVSLFRPFWLTIMIPSFLMGLAIIASHVLMILGFFKLGRLRYL